jgi:hypothetical protein
MKAKSLALLAAFAALVGIASVPGDASAQVGCGKFGCYNRSGPAYYGGGWRPRAQSQPRSNWRAVLRERQRAARIAQIAARERARRAAIAAAARRAAATTTAAAPLAAFAATGPGVPLGDLDVNKVPTLNRDGVRRVQQVLKDRGFDPGPVNGVPGARMKDAVSAFQTRYGINANGDVDNQTLLALGEAELASQSNR